MKKKPPKPSIVYRLVANLVPYPNNPRTHSADQVAQIAASIEEYGWTNPILTDGEGGIIAGHGRIMAAQKLGMDKVPCIDLVHLTPEQRRAYVIADNKLALNAGWDDKLLTLELGELRLGGFDLDLTGFSGDELAGLGVVGAEEGLTDPDAIPEPSETPVSARGDLWALGAHRLLCGDATDEGDVGRVMDGEKADMVFTDPPYGVGYDGGMKKRAKLQADEIGTTIYGDALPLMGAIAADHAALYLWYADAHAAAAAAAAAGYQIVAQIIWSKNHAQFVTAARYKGKHEPCFYAHKKGKSAAWYGPNNEVTVWEYDRAPSNDYHPTQKPVALASRAIRNSSKADDVVADFFGGSGATMIACEQSERHCRMMEIEPTYCDIIVRRWQEYTGEDATLDGDGRSFNDIADHRIGKAA